MALKTYGQKKSVDLLRPRAAWRRRQPSLVVKARGETDGRSEEKVRGDTLVDGAQHRCRASLCDKGAGK